MTWQHRREIGTKHRRNWQSMPVQVGNQTMNTCFAHGACLRLESQENECACGGISGMVQEAWRNEREEGRTVRLEVIREWAMQSMYRSRLRLLPCVCQVAEKLTMKRRDHGRDVGRMRSRATFSVEDQDGERKRTCLAVLTQALDLKTSFDSQVTCIYRILLPLHLAPPQLASI